MLCKFSGLYNGLLDGVDNLLTVEIPVMQGLFDFTLCINYVNYNFVYRKTHTSISVF